VVRAGNIFLPDEDEEETKVMLNRERERERERERRRREFDSLLAIFFIYPLIGR